jgi:malonyl-CoA O-methyltransferase/biotin synthesis protein BioG
MKSKFVSHTAKNRRLVIIFAGWAMDYRPFKGLVAPGYDIMVIWDYRELSFSWKIVDGYKEICVIAWSLGVFAASLTTHEIMARVTKMIAVNGTLEPIHPSRGIDPALYQATLRELTPTSLRKFYRRMCSSAEEFTAFKECCPKREFSELADELVNIETQTIFHVPQVDRWDLALISRYDRIFQAPNQQNAWRGIAPQRIMELGHLPDFQMIISRLIIDKERVKARFSASQSTYDAEAQAQNAIAKRLYEFFENTRDTREVAGTVIEVGSGHGALTRQYAPHHSCGPIHLWDIADLPAVAELSPDARFKCCDAEIMMKHTPTASAKFIFSASTVQWFNSPATFFRECERVLVPGGWLVISTFAHGNLPEVESVVGPTLTLPTLRGWLSMIPPTMTVLSSSEDGVTLRFDNPREVLKHLKNTGVTGVTSMTSPVVAARRLLNEYPVNLDGSCPLTYRPVYIVAQKPDTD